MHTTTFFSGFYILFMSTASRGLALQCSSSLHKLLGPFIPIKLLHSIAVMLSPYPIGQMHVLCVCVCVCAQVLYGLEEEGKEKSDDSRPLLGDNVPTSERTFWDIFGGSKLQNRGQYSTYSVVLIISVTHDYHYLSIFTAGSTVHHKLNSTSKPSLSLLSAPPHNALPLSPIPQVTVTTSAGV